MVMRCRLYLPCLFLFFGAFFRATTEANGIVVTNSNGSVGYIYRSTDYASGAYDNQHLLKANVDNAFYIWRDWFVTGSSSLVFTQDQTLSENGSSDTFSVTGQVGLNVLPQSSTPFGLSYSRSDSRLNSDLKANFGGINTPTLDDNVVNDSLVLHQSLLGKGYRLKFKYSDNQFNSSLRGKYGSNKIGISGTLRSKSGVLNASVSHKDEVTYDKVDRITDTARLNHNYTGFRQTTISTALSHSQVQQTLSSLVTNNGVQLSEYDVILNQASVSLVWRSLDKKITMTSGLRFSGIESSVGNQLEGVSSSALSGNVGLTYRINSNLTANVNSLRVVNSYSDEETTVAQDRVGIKYRSDEIILGKYRYDWRFGGDLGRREDDGKESNSSTFSLGHAIGRKWGLMSGQQVYARGSQDYSMDSLIDRVRQRLSHRVSLGWKQMGLGMSRRVQLQVSDQRGIDDETVLQTLSFDVNQQSQVTRRIKLNGVLNFQQTNYQYSGSEGVSLIDSTVISADVGLSYLNPFSVAGLGFTSNYRYSQSVSTSDTGEVNQQTWNNKLNYRVGKIDASLQYLYREARKISYNGIYFSVKRVF